MRVLGLVLVLLVVVQKIDCKSDTVRVCVAGNRNQKASREVKSCEQLARSKKTHATCVFGNDRVECLRLVEEKKADLTLLEAQDLPFAIDPPIVAVSEVREEKDQKYKEMGVVLVRKNVGVAPDLRGARLCHPGWVGQDEGVNNLFTQYLELRLAPQNCNANLSLFEDRIRTTAQYFGPSCKAGQWSRDKAEDLRLKTLYPSLCAACESSSCPEGDKYWGSGGAVTCFKDEEGDALWTTLADVRQHFQDAISGNERQKYEYLCDDRSTMSMMSPNPCIWFASPWPMVVAHPKSAMDVQKALALLNDDTNDDWEDGLLNVFFAQKAFVVNLEETEDPKMILNRIPGFSNSYELAYPRCNPSHSITWCTKTSPERERCEYIMHAAQQFILAPGIQCKRRTSMEQCIKMVADKMADITVVPADYNPLAQLKGLEGLFYEDISRDGAYTLSAFMKNKSETNLRNKRACFTLHDGLAWRAAIVNLRKEGEISSSCGSSGLLQSYFSSICVTAGENSELPYCCGTRNDADPDKAALDCLIKKGCDVAFINNNTLYTNADGRNTEPWTDGLRSSDYKSICRHDTPRMQQYKECGWVVAPPSAIMGSTSMDAVRRSDVNHLLTEISKLFSRRNKKHLMLSLFAPFEGQKNVMFQDASSHLTKYPDQGPPGASMEEIIQATTECSAANTLQILGSLLICSFLIHIFR